MFEYRTDVIETSDDTSGQNNQMIMQNSDSPLTEFSTIKITMTSDTTSSAHQLHLNEPSDLVVGFADTAIKQKIEDAVMSNPMVGTFTVHARKHQGSYVDDNFFSDEVDESMCDIAELSVELLDITFAPNILDIDTDEKLRRACAMKEFGTKMFKAGNIQLAFKKYQRAMRYLILIQKSVMIDLPDKVEEYKTLCAQCYLNIAACQMLRHAFEHASVNCTKALLIEESNVKALYR